MMMMMMSMMIVIKVLFEKKLNYLIGRRIY